ncbi:MAG TPA: enolase C-terminal domain-like protein [Myxococcales bacterium]
MTRFAGRAPLVDRLDVSVYAVPTDAPESDGTFAWDQTTMVLVRVGSGQATGLGFTYADKATAALIADRLAPLVKGRDATAIQGTWRAMVQSIRNLGRPGICSMAISAVDVALWDLKARLFDVPLASLLGQARERVPVYGSGGFTSYSLEKLREQLGGWVAQGIKRVKMKVGRAPGEDLARVAAAREAIGPDAELFVDANGAYSRKQALSFAQEFAEQGVTWFEEPVSSDDLPGLRLLRDRGPAGMAVAAGEYGYDAFYFQRMVEAGAVDVLQADATRCGGITGFLQAAEVCEAYGIPLSAHTAPAVHLHVGCAAPRVLHLEYFHDHARIEQMLFEGAQQPREGALKPDALRPGLGLEFKEADARKFAVV